MNTSHSTALAALKAALVAAPVLGLAAGVGAYFGVRAASPIARTQVDDARAAAAPGAAIAPRATDAGPDEALAAAALAREIQRLGSLLERLDSARRTAVPADDAPSSENAPIVPADAQALLAALDRAVAAIQRAGERIAGPGTAGVQMPTGPMNVERLQELSAKSPGDATLEHAYWSVQRVLDTYGRPSELSAGFMTYDDESGDTFRVTFKLGETGFVESVYP
ncbi:MAG: hypothetical protein GC161_15460 [Planctomycetaceae bacterium]|nr:hypothetical protein [Planctomycetaceae bacterium]